MTDREIVAAALRWHRAYEVRLAAGTESNKFKSEQKRTTGFGGADLYLSRRVTQAKKIELTALRELARACTKVRDSQRQVDDASEVIDVLCLTC